MEYAFRNKKSGKYISYKDAWRRKETTSLERAFTEFDLKLAREILECLNRDFSGVVGRSYELVQVRKVVGKAVKP